jgi:hypothetical protein
MERLLVEAPASAVELGKRLIEEAEEGRLLAADIHDNPVCTVNYDARIPAIVVVWKRYVTSLQLRFVHEKMLEMIVEHSAHKILGDDTDLSVIHPRDQDWILHDWMPRAFKAGLKAAASKRPSGYFGRLSTTSIQSQAEALRHQAFDDIASARDWLTRCEVA